MAGERQNTRAWGVGGAAAGWLWRAPCQALCRAQDFYVWSITGCASHCLQLRLPDVRRHDADHADEQQFRLLPLLRRRRQRRQHARARQRRVAEASGGAGRGRRAGGRRAWPWRGSTRTSRASSPELGWYSPGAVPWAPALLVEEGEGGCRGMNSRRRRRSHDRMMAGCGAIVRLRSSASSLPSPRPRERRWLRGWAPPARGSCRPRPWEQRRWRRRRLPLSPSDAGTPSPVGLISPSPTGTSCYRHSRRHLSPYVDLKRREKKKEKRDPTFFSHVMWTPHIDFFFIFC